MALKAYVFQCLLNVLMNVQMMLLAVAMARLVERSLQKTEATVFFVEKPKIKKKWPEMAHFQQK